MEPFFDPTESLIQDMEISYPGHGYCHSGHRYRCSYPTRGSLVVTGIISSWILLIQDPGEYRPGHRNIIPWTRHFQDTEALTPGHVKPLIQDVVTCLQTVHWSTLMAAVCSVRSAH